MERPDSDDLDELDDDLEKATPEEAAELRRYEAERAERRARRNMVSGRITGWIVAAALVFLVHDSGGAALHARDQDRPWGSHALVAGAALAGLILLVALAVRAARRRGRE